MTTVNNFEIFKNFFEEFEGAANECGIRVFREKLVGRKKDLISLSKEICPELKILKESTFEEFLKRLGCKFQSAPISKNDFRIRDLIAPHMRSLKI
jgi:hypothetical protein